MHVITTSNRKSRKSARTPSIGIDIFGLTNHKGLGGLVGHIPTESCKLYIQFAR